MYESLHHAFESQTINYKSHYFFPLLIGMPISRNSNTFRQSVSILRMHIEDLHEDS